MKVHRPTTGREQMGVSTVGVRTAIATAIITITSLLVLATPATAGAPAGAPGDWNPPAGALPGGPVATYLQHDDDASGLAPFGLANTYEDANIDASSFDGGRTGLSITVNGDRDWGLRLDGAGAGSLLSPGVHLFGDVGQPTGDFDIDGSSCTALGWIDVSSGVASADGRGVAHLDATFGLDCQDSTLHAWHGAIVWDASTPSGDPYPLTPPDDLWRAPAGAVSTTGNSFYAEGGLVGAGGHGASGPDVSVVEPTDRNDGDAKILRATARLADGRPISVEVRVGEGLSQLAVGYYAHVAWSVANPVTGGIDLTVGSTDCPTTDGWFSIDELTQVSGTITHIAMRFGQSCGAIGDPGAMALGELHWTLSPTVTALVPNTGIRSGGEIIRIDGRDLSRATAVSIGGVDAPIQRAPNNLLEVQVPDLAPGQQDVVVTTPGGEASVRGADGFQVTSETSGAPFAVTVQPGELSAVVSWMPSNLPGDTPLTGVEVRVFPWSQPDKATSVTVGPDDTTAFVGGLDPTITYVAVVVEVDDVGLGEASVPSPSFQAAPADVEPFDGVPQLVAQQYVDFAGRAPTTAESSLAVNAIRHGLVAPGAWVAPMRNRPEWGAVRSPIIRLYSSFFARLPDAGGLAHWSSQLRTKSSTLGDVATTFASSSEFKRKYGALSNTGFVDLVYRNVLGRQPDATGRAHWVRKLTTGTRRASIMLSFSESNEHVRTSQPSVDAVLLYTGMLRRMPTAVEMATALRPATPSAASVHSSLGGTASPASTPIPPDVLAQDLLRSSAYAARF